MKKLFLILFIVGCLLGIGVIVFYFQVKLTPPEIQDKSAETITVNNHGPHTRVACNGSWLKRNQYGIWEMYLKGDPYELGYSFGKLTKPLLREKESAFVGEIKNRLPSDNYFSFLKYLVGWFNRDLDEYVKDEYLVEIYGSSQFMPDDYDDVTDKFHRALGYHAAHDIGHALQNMNLVGCTAFAVRDDFSEKGNLLIGRNFDFYFGLDFSHDKILAFYNPTNGYRFASVTWAGFSGVVSGMNETGLTVTLNSAKSDIPGKGKTPVSIIAREILQYASTIEEAMEIAKNREAFVSESFLIGSARDNAIGVIEKTKDETVLFIPQSKSFVLTNHFQSPKLKKSKLNVSYMAEGVSIYRYHRVEELIDSLAPLTQTDAVKILRNKKGLGGKEIGLGNEKAVNQLIAHHGVVFSPEGKQITLSAEPFSLGAFVSYNLDSVFANSDSYLAPVYDTVISADPFLKTSAFSDYSFFLQIKDRIQTFIMSGKGEELTESELDEFQKANSNSYLTYYYLGDYYLNLERYKEAFAAFQKGLKLDVARKSERLHMREGMREAQDNLNQ